MIDTGGRNTGFVASQATADAANVKLDRSKARRAILGIRDGRPHYTTIYPFTVTRLALGAAVRCNVPGVVGDALPLPFGFDTGGTISLTHGLECIALFCPPAMRVPLTIGCRIGDTIGVIDVVWRAA